MLPPAQRIAFLVFAAVLVFLSGIGFYRLGMRLRRGRPDTEPRGNRPWRRFWYAVLTASLQTRTFRRRPVVSVFHAFIFYGFAFYLLLNVVDLLEGFFPISIRSVGPWSSAYNLCADVLSFLVLVGVVALVLRRYLLPSRRDFRFNQRTPLHEDIRRGHIVSDSAIVSAFIFFHVGSRTVEQAAKLLAEGGDPFQPFAGLVAQAIPLAHAAGFAELGFWGALGSIFAFLAYFPWTKHIHIFFAPLKYFFHREADAGELPPLKFDSETPGEVEEIGAHSLEDLGWPRLLDAYACIQCNRCQDACPASQTGKALSPAALEINKRMELNRLSGGLIPASASAFERGGPSPRPLLEFALSPEALWACTACGACLEVCPVQDEPMLDIMDIRRHQVMVEGKFPSELQTAFRGMERAGNPWGLSRARRMDWAEGLGVRTTAENPDHDVLLWVGCAASYDPGAQRTMRSLVRLLQLAKVNFAVLGDREGCTGDPARRAGNELLYRQLATSNITVLDELRPRLILTACPHCLNAIGKEYRQLGGNYRVMHHSEFLATLVDEGKLKPQQLPAQITYHDPCYLGRMHGVYEAPRDVLRSAGARLTEMKRNRSGSFCCGAGGAQFWKEEEPGRERIAANRFREAEQTLSGATGDRVLAVSCPFCKNMLGSARSEAGSSAGVAVKDIAEVLLESMGEAGAVAELRGESETPAADEAASERWTPAPRPVEPAPAPSPEPAERPAPEEEEHRSSPEVLPEKDREQMTPPPPAPPPARKVWKPKGK